MNEIVGQKILILGYGTEGKSVHKYLLENFPELKISIADKQEVKPSLPYDKIFNGRKYLQNLDDYSTAIRSPGVPSLLPELIHYNSIGGHITTATNIFFSKCFGKTIAVTGTKGKSTTASLISTILCQNFSDVRLVGNIGRPVLDYLNKQTGDSIFVVELSSHQLEDVRYSPLIAVLLNIVPEHLDHYQNFNQYLSAKEKIVKHQTAAGFVIYNPQHKIIKKIAEKSLAKRVVFSLKQKPGIQVFIKNKAIFCQEKEVVKISSLPLKSSGNTENCLAAITVAHLLAVPISKISQAVKKFKPLPHRLEIVGTYQGITFVNDSLATVPQATINAFSAFPHQVTTLIAGGFDRGITFQRLAEFLLNQPQLATVILFPDTGYAVRRIMLNQRSKKTPQIFLVNSMQKAVQLAYKYTAVNSICMMSPAAASFNMFKNYADRGEQFVLFVKKYAKKQ